MTTLAAGASTCLRESKIGRVAGAHTRRYHFRKWSSEGDGEERGALFLPEDAPQVARTPSRARELFYEAEERDGWVVSDFQEASDVGLETKRDPKDTSFFSGKGFTADAVTVTVNGTEHVISQCDSVGPRTSLAEWLRYDLGLCGTKIGCHEGGCGAVSSERCCGRPKAPSAHRTRPCVSAILRITCAVLRVYSVSNIAVACAGQRVPPPCTLS